MTRRPVPNPDRELWLSPTLCGPAEQYAAAWSAGRSAWAWDEPFDKRAKETHRFTIADTRGRLDLTVPVAKPESSKCRWSEVKISTHGAWWDVHRVALESAYGRTPYFEFYIDRFLPMLTAGVEERYPLLRDLALAWDAQIRDILGMEPAADTLGEGALTTVPEKFTALPYRQVRQQQLGFVANLSVLDLIFNLGPEAAIYLNNLCSNV